MNEEQFWVVIQTMRNDALKQNYDKRKDINKFQKKLLSKELEKLLPAEIQDFDTVFYTLLNYAYSYRLWGAAYWYNGGCSDDCFWDFRSTLISLGKELFYKVTDDPEHIAELIGLATTPFLADEGFQYVAWKVYKEKMGKDMPVNDVKFTDIVNTEYNFDFDDETLMKKYYPKLTSQCPSMEC